MRGRRSEATASTSFTCNPTNNASSTKRRKSMNRGRPQKSSDNADSRMEMYDHFYTNFERPPLAPIFYPTPEEFSDPIEYVAKIRAEAEPYGVVKIVPPKTFHPPFAIDKSTFTFVPRNQKLNEIEAIVKEKHTFIERLINYNRMSGVTFEIPVDKDGKLIDLHRLHRIVYCLGGIGEVNEKDKWKDVAREMMSSDKNPRGIPPTFVKLLKSVYTTYVEPFVRNLREKSMKADDESDDEMEELKHKYQHHHGAMRNDKNNADEPNSDAEAPEDCPVSMQGGKRQSKKKKATRQSRMMAGGFKHTAPTKKKAPRKQEDDPMDSVFCITCDGGENEHLLLLCDIEGCNNGRHTYCCDPPLEKVPDGEWRCPKCIEAEDAKIGLDWGFYDANVEYNLNTFAEFANQFKCNYFGVDDPMSVPCEKVEKEFWKNVIAGDDEVVTVKYGADLITSRVGSGFPRKDDKFVGHDARVRHQYANHTWNLNNLPVLKESVLSHINTGISGMMVPWVYVGMCFSTFCWHTEDHWTYSINYNHWGERKIWYGVGGDDAEKFEDALRQLAPGLTSRQRDLFHHMTTAANPALLRSFGVPIYTVHQNPGEFVITFPRAYHSGFNEGLNFAEAVNFAPIDWLSKGRLCINEYSHVRRYCVFSHDELVFKMVEAGDKLGISMSVSTLDELMEISKREQTYRLLISQLGVTKQEKVQFEELVDDHRTCRFCRTTLFLSALSCKHKKIVCLEHYDHLCKRCSIESCILQIRYELDELFPFIDQLENRTTEYYSWKSKADMILHEGDKPEPRQIEELIEMAKQNHYPMTSHMQNLLAINKKTKGVIEKANALLNGKIRTRVRTRIQRADTRFDVEGIREFISEMKMMSCELGSLVENLEGLLTRIEEWRERANEVINFEEIKSEEQKKLLSAQDIGAIIAEGEEFDIKLEELTTLKKIVDMKEWESKASELIEWCPYEKMENENDYEFKKRWTHDEVMGLIREGSRFIKNGPKDQLLKLQNMLKRARVHDSDAEEYLNNPKFDQLPFVWNDIRNSDWFTDKHIDKIRIEVLRVGSIVQFFEKLAGHELKTMNLTEMVDNLENTHIKFADIVEICALFEDTISLNKSANHLKLIDLKQVLETFTEKIVKLFKCDSSYHNLYDILSEREEITALAEGQNVVMHLQPDSVSGCDEWNQITEFDTVEQMMQHQTSLRSTQKMIIDKLQVTNKGRGIEACSCLGASADSTDPTITCLLCRAKYHVKCCEWSPFLQNLPDGSFLCSRCLRGRRPVIEDVQATCVGAASNSFELNLVKYTLNKSRDVGRELIESVANLNPTIASDIQRCRESLNEFLSCEILNLNALPKAAELIQVLYDDVLRSQEISFIALREKPRTLTPLPALFEAKIAMGRKGKRNSNASGKEVARKTKRRSRVIGSDYYEHNDDQLCSAEQCCTPYGDQVNWIMCDAGCERWFHYICVGLTVDEISQIQNYSCKKCMTSAGSTGSVSSTSTDA